MALTVARTKCFAGANARRAAAPARTVRMVVRASAKPELPAFVKPAITALVSNALLATPALAESGKLFDFNLTLPVMAGEILLLMVFLEKFWFTPVGKVLDARDTQLREQLSSVKDGSSELDRLTKEAEDLVRAARAEVSTLVNSQKSAKQAELDKLYADAKAKVTAETESAIAGMEKESEALLKSLDSQAEKIAGEVLRRVLPEGVKV